MCWTSLSTVINGSPRAAANPVWGNLSNGVRDADAVDGLKTIICAIGRSLRVADPINCLLALAGSLRTDAPRIRGVARAFRETLCTGATDSITVAYALDTGEVELLGRSVPPGRLSIACASDCNRRHDTFASSTRRSRAAMGVRMA
jgi:hypothetical protein